MSSPRDRFGPAGIPVMRKTLLFKGETHVGSSSSSPTRAFLVMDHQACNVVSLAVLSEQSDNLVMPGVIHLGLPH